MKRKYFDCRFWDNIVDRRLEIKEIEAEDFKGIISLLKIDSVKETELWNFGDYDFIITDKGMEWFRMMPKGKNYNITAIINTEGKIVMWYTDIIKSYGYDEAGDLYFDDLYLDVIALESGIIKVKDMEDLENALSSGEIDFKLFEAAIKAKDELLSGYFSDVKKFKVLTDRLRKEFD